MAKSLQLRCPICKKPVARTDEDFPFCSARCRAIDLGRWASGQYVVPASAQDEDEDGLADLPQRDPDEPQ
jgi:endogenous inhibitor of DNA gyrase (YacG/DUF329 family)